MKLLQRVTSTLICRVHCHAYCYQLVSWSLSPRIAGREWPSVIQLSSPESNWPTTVTMTNRHQSTAIQPLLLANICHDVILMHLCIIMSCRYTKCSLKCLFWITVNVISIFNIYIFYVSWITSNVSLWKSFVVLHNSLPIIKTIIWSYVSKAGFTQILS